MVTLNPHFRGADEVRLPPNLFKFGWTDGTVSKTEAVYHERTGADRLISDMPIAFRQTDPPAPIPAVVQAFDEFQKAKGRGPNSKDWSLLDEFVLKKVLLWKPQIIGSCVLSNTFRGWTVKLMYQIAFLGMPYEYLGRNEFGSANYAFYAPFSYGMARRRGNMRSGDGLYCDVMVETLLKDGVLSCSTPKLIEICKSKGFAGDLDFPEPQNEGFYRAWGNWSYLDDVKQYADFALQDFPYMQSAEELKARLEFCGCAPICSMIAIKKIGTHKDGFAIHGRDTSTSWAHNMCFHGYFYASDGQLFFRFSNESWGETHIYNVPFEEVSKWFRTQDVTCASIGLINGPRSAPLAA